MDNIILFLVNESVLKKFKDFTPEEFFGESNSYKGIKFSEKLSTEGNHSLFINGDGFKTLPNPNNINFFEEFKKFEPAKTTVEKILGKDPETFNKIESEQPVHLFAFYESDIEEYKKNANIFQIMARYVKNEKRENKAQKTACVSLRIYKEEQAPIAYVANIPDKVSLFFNINKNLITYYGNENIEIN